MKVGDKVKIKECHSVPELVGQEAEVIKVAEPLSEEQTQAFVTLYGKKPYTVAIKITTGEHAGKPLPFREEELEEIVQEATNIPLGTEGIPNIFLEALKAGGGQVEGGGAVENPVEEPNQGEEKGEDGDDKGELAPA